MAIPQTPLKLEGTSPQTEDSPVKRLQEKLTLKIQNLGNRVKETEKVLETGGTMLRLKPGESAADIERLKKQVAHAEQLKQVMNQIHAAKDLDQIFVGLREGILGLLGAERLTLYAVDYDKKEIYSKFLDPDTLKDIKEIRVPVNEQSIAGFVAKNTKTVNITDAYNKGELTKISPVLSFDSSWDQKTGFRTKQILTVPLFSSDNLLTGVMQLVNKKTGDRFTKEDEERVQEIATTLGIAFYNQYQLARKKPTRFDYLISSGLITQVELDATIKEAREKQKEIESLLMEKYKTPRKEIGKSLSLFYKCPFLEFDERVFIPPDLVKNISLNYLKANYWIPLRRSEDSVDVLIDDTPDAVTISCFDPIRRQVAKVALERLIADGRIQPSKIEDVVKKVQEDVEKEIEEAGAQAAADTGVAGLHPDILKILGRLKYRTSYGQNVLKHSIEVGNIAGLLAAELGAEANICRKAGLLHDLGKAVDHDIPGAHHHISMDICRKYGMSEIVLNAIGAHHDDIDPKTVEAIIVRVSDGISGGRVGARRDTLENYIKRLTELENIANSFPGVDKSFAIQAGREVRIIVRPSEVDDLGALRLSKDIAKKIEQDMQYPGTIKVNVIREVRQVTLAK